MPSPSADKPAVKKTSDKQNAAQFGSKLAKRKSQDFASKIQGWDLSGADSAQRDDEVVVVIEPEHDTKKEAKPGLAPSPKQKGGNDEGALHAKLSEGTPSSPNTPPTPATMPKTGAKATPSKSKVREIDLERKAWVRKKSKPQVEMSEELKQATTPKKRLVSDGHWRRDKAAAKPDSPAEKEPVKVTTPKPITIKRSVVSVGLKIPPSTQDFIEVDPESEPTRVRPLRASRSRSRSRSRGRDATPDYEDSGVKVYIKRRRPVRTDEKGLSASGSSFTGGSSTDRPSSTTDITTPTRSSNADKISRPSTAPRERNSDYLSGPEELQARRKGSRRKSSGPVSDDEIRKHSKTAPPPVHEGGKLPASSAGPRVFGNRIEGWLATMPEDPFTNSRNSLTPEPLAISKRASRTSPKSNKTQSQDDNAAEMRRSGVRQRKSKPSLEPINTETTGSRRNSPRSTSPSDASRETSVTTPTLRRSGARRATHSPVKDRESRALSLDDTPAVPTEHYSAPGKLKGGRIIPNGGKRLSTIASIEKSHSRPLLHYRAPSDTSEQPTHILEESALSHASDGDDRHESETGLKRRLTKHSDLISVLSMSHNETRGLVPARSIRTKRIRNGDATIGDIMNEITMDELKYQRELRTLVDGVIPVLLTYVLQKTDPSGRKRLFSGSSHEGQTITRPIVEMGIALERLKATHKRIPMHKPEDLLHWASSAAKAYADYLKVWRLGFSDVVVSLAPAEETPKNPSWEAGLPSKNQDDLSRGDGERVDVAYLLKRPLVRLKYLTKTFKGIDLISPSPKAAEMAAKYHELVTEARRRANDERGRLEDEAASAIDPTRARDPRSLAPIRGVTIDRTRSVRARDYFDLDLWHSSGQQLGCKIEIIIRDDAPGRGTAADILFCEVSTTDRWLLFPPVLASHVSARIGDRPGEIIVMIRGFLSAGQEWREVFSLQSDDEGAVDEWLGMLSATPVPSKLLKTSSFNVRRNTPLRVTTSPAVKPLEKTQAPPPREIEVPIGEKVQWASSKWDASEVNSVMDDDGDDTLSSLYSTERRKRYQSMPASSITEDSYEEVHAKYFSEQDRQDAINSRSRYQRRPVSSHQHSISDWSSESAATTPKKEYRVWLPSTDAGSDGSSGEEEDRSPPQRPSMNRRPSSVPSGDMPSIPKIRQSSQPSTPHKSTGEGKAGTVSATDGYEPVSAPAQFPLRQPQASKNSQNTPQTSPSVHARPTSLGLRSSVLPSFTPAFLKKHRRSSSPLKHEYEPSTGSESFSESDLSDNDDDADSVTSESSAGEGVSTVGTLKDFQQFGMRPRQMRPASQPLPPRSPISSPDNTLSPSESASQAPYRTVPPSTVPPVKTVASIFCWAERGCWDSLHPEECCIVVTPGLIEAFDLAQAHAVTSGPDDDPHASPSTRGVKPLVALELTPLVPLRRGTALDISIRSPPTDKSLIRTGNNVMFRSHSAEECERLYNLINRARIDNPTYVALQNARGPAKSSNWAEVMDQRNNARVASGGSWWNMGSRKSTTYRSKGTRAASTAATESSVASAFSALRRFSGGSRIFNIAKSRVTSREGTRSSYSDSLDSGAATPLPIDPSMGTPLGITNAKIRLYVRESAGQWRDMGAARLTVMMPPRRDPATAHPTTTGLEKRILVSGKSKGETLLDVMLGENCFERIARTGIAVSVYEEIIGPNGEVGHVGAIGGVGSARTRIYMLQMRSVSSPSNSVKHHMQDRGSLTFSLPTSTGTRCCVHIRSGWQTTLLNIFRKLLMTASPPRRQADLELFSDAVPVVSFLSFQRTALPPRSCRRTLNNTLAPWTYVRPMTMYTILEGNTQHAR
nr:hypothetical protein CFP56_46663 [Quercus suber]